MILTPIQKLPNNVGNLGKIIVATSFEWLPKVKKNRQIWSHWLWHISKPKNQQKNEKWSSFNPPCRRDKFLFY